MKKTPIIIVGTICIVSLFSCGLFVGKNASTLKNEPTIKQEIAERHINEDTDFIEQYISGNKTQNQKIQKEDLKIVNEKTGEEIDLSLNLPLKESGLMHILEFQKDEWTGLNKMPIIEPNKSMLFAGNTEDNCIFTIGVYNETNSNQKASDCQIKYIKFTNGTDWAAIGIDFTMDKKNIIYQFGEPNRDQIYQDVELLSYICVYEQKLYTISFVLNAQTEDCVEIAIDIDNRVAHKEY